MASFSRISFSEGAFGGFSLDFPESPLAVAVQGIGFDSSLVAVQGFSVEIEGIQRSGSSSKQNKKQVKNDDEEVLEILSMIMYEMC